MDFYLRTYNLLLHGFGREILRLLSRKSLRDPEFRQGRLGCYGEGPVFEKTPRIWFHAVSVGEVSGAVPTVLALARRLPESGLVLSAGTPQGLRAARERLPEDVAVVPFPLDFKDCVERALDTVRPDLFVAFETEFWPNFYHCLGRRGIPALLFNGRVSVSSARIYGLLAPLFRPVFDHFELMAMHSEEDRERAVRIGADPGKAATLGSSKYDGLAGRARPERAAFWKDLLGLDGSAPVLVAGSLRGSECFELIGIFQKLREISPGLVAILVPRHLYNVPKMARRLRERKIPCDLLTDIESGRSRRDAPVVLVDRMGALFELYSAGDLIFCGGTLEPVGGHNILEPAAWSKPVFYGPYLKKVLHEHRILQGCGGSFRAADAGDLLAQWRKWIEDPEGLRQCGIRARVALDELGGVVERQVELVLEILSKRKAAGGQA